MNFYAIDVLMFGTVYIKAADRQTADRILDKLCARTIDALDKDWFSELAPQYLPMVSFGTSFTTDGPLPDADLIEVSEDAVDLAQSGFTLGWRDTLIPNAENVVEFEDMPVYAVDLDLTTKAFVLAGSLEQAGETLKTFKGTHIDLEMRYWHWFSKPSEVFGSDSEISPPPVLSSALYVRGRSTGCQLCRTWPEIFYRRGPDGTYVAVEVEVLKNPQWPAPTELLHAL